MRRSARSQRRRTIALTSLIDVIFILLLFFLLSSTFTRFGEINLATSSRATGSVSASASPIFLRLEADTLTLNGAPLGLETLLPALRDVAPPDGGNTRILVAVAGDVSSQRLVELLVVLRPLDWADVAVLG
jgi:biopolymer transport protein ExbD